MDLDPRIGETHLRTSATIRESPWISSRAGLGVDGQLVLAERADDRPGPLIWFADDSGKLRFAGGWEDVAGYRYINRWRSHRTVEVSLREGRSVTFAGPRKMVTAIVDGYGRAVPVRH